MHYFRIWSLSFKCDCLTFFIVQLFGMLIHFTKKVEKILWIFFCLGWKRFSGIKWLVEAFWQLNWTGFLVFGTLYRKLRPRNYGYSVLLWNLTFCGTRWWQTNSGCPIIVENTKFKSYTTLKSSSNSFVTFMASFGPFSFFQEKKSEIY